MSDPSLSGYRLEQAEKKIEELANHCAALQKQLIDLEKHEAERETKRLMWGVSTLGAVVMTLGGIIWSYRAVIFK